MHVDIPAEITRQRQSMLDRNFFVLGRHHKKDSKHVHLISKAFLYVRRQDGELQVTFLVERLKLQRIQFLQRGSHPMSRKSFLRMDNCFDGINTTYSTFFWTTQADKYLHHHTTSTWQKGIKGEQIVVVETRIKTVASHGLEHHNNRLECFTTH